MEEIFYTKDHCWIYVDNEIVTVGLTEYFLDMLEEINYIELPQVKTLCNRNDIIGNIVTSKEEVNIYSAFLGEITEVNYLIEEDYELLKHSSIENAWLYRINATSLDLEMDDLLTREEYENFIEQEN